MNKAKRLAEFREYGYIEIGETENDETILAKRHDSGNVLIMALHEKHISQIRLSTEQFEKLSTI